jgi:hypothetical protein
MRGTVPAACPPLLVIMVSVKETSGRKIRGEFGFCAKFQPTYQQSSRPNSIETGQFSRIQTWLIIPLVF